MRGLLPLSRDGSDRGQVYTLEGFAAAAVVLFALLFAMQSVVVTPGTGGAVDRTAQAQIQQEAQDALVVAAHSNQSDSGNLSELVHDWAEDGQLDSSSPTDEFENEYVLGEILATHVSESAYPDDYTVEVAYLNQSDPDDVTTEYVAGTVINDSSAVTASYSVPIFDDGDDYDGLPDDGEYPVYNIVEVRVTVW